MEKFFVKYRKLEDELANPITTFMRATFDELKLDIKEEAHTNYTEYTSGEVSDLLDGDKERWYIIYSRHEQAFCASQYLKKMDSKRRRKEPLLLPIKTTPNTAVSEDGYEPDQYGLKYLAHRIKLQARELLNARQFIMQAEEMISKRSERDKRQLERLRKTYAVHKKIVNYTKLSSALAYAETVDTADADKFGETYQYESEYF
uniref:50S ribosomal protein L1 n=1 Tax=Zeugodacus cucurbitae TaxID=28588 RepID=A0A0A1X311_ZEUCU